MSCHSSHNLGPLAAARVVNDLDDAQISKAFHDLKKGAARDLGAAARHPVSPVEVEGYLLHLRERVAHDDRIPESKKERILSRLDATLESVQVTGKPYVDRATFEAWQRLPVTAQQTKAALDDTLHTVSTRLGISMERARDYFQYLRDDPHTPNIDLNDSMHPHLQEYAFTDPYLPSDARSKKALNMMAWESYLAEPAPVFVYGTLRTGQHNSRLLANRYASKHAARMPGVALHSTPGVGFPWGVDDPEHLAHGELVHLRNDEQGAEARESLDYLEGFRSDNPDASLYVRSIRTAVVEDENGHSRQTNAWVYVATPLSRERFGFGVSDDTRVPSGDWFDVPGVRFKPEYADRQHADLSS